MGAGAVDEEFERLALDSLLTDSNVVTVVLDRNMIVRWISPSADAFGLAPVGRSVIELVHTDDLDRVATTFDMTGGPDDYQSSLLTNVVIPLRVATPTRLVPFEASGRWLRGADREWYFVVAMMDVTTRFATSEALRILAGEIDELAAVQVLVDACRSFRGIDGAQVVWNAMTGPLVTVGDLGTEVAHLGPLAIDPRGLRSGGSPIELPGYDWAHAFPVTSGEETLGTFGFWGWGPTPEPRFLATVVAPLLDLAALALTRSRAQNALAERAVTDEVTGLLNRRGFLDQFPVRHNEWVAVMYIDLDDFKQVNDRFGHAAGDRVLTLVGQRLRQVLSRGDVVARIGGDEFAVLCRWIRAEAAETIAVRVLDALNQPFDVDGVRMPGGASIGLTVGTRRSTGPELLDRADRALMQAKAGGKRRLARAGDDASG